MLSTSIKNTRIETCNKLLTPNKLIQQLPITDDISKFILNTRESISNILKKKDKRLLFIIGPCSIHNIEEAKYYGRWLKQISNIVKDKFLIVMRVYFEKPRTSIGWKGFINDPDLNNTHNVSKGIFLARELLLYLNNIRMPCAYEVLDTIIPQYISDLISWGAIGARTTESQIHRQLVSGLSMPMGFKNNIQGDITVPINAIISANNPHCFPGITDEGEPAIFNTKGNKDTHIILRGSVNGPNYKSIFVNKTISLLRENNLPLNIMIDCSHGNSLKDYRNQSTVFIDIITQILNKNTSIIGCMIESNINEGSQKLDRENLQYGVSITDSCIGFEETNKLLLWAFNVLDANS